MCLNIECTGDFNEAKIHVYTLNTTTIFVQVNYDNIKCQYGAIILRQPHSTNKSVALVIDHLNRRESHFV